MPIRLDGWPGTTRKLPPRSSNEQFSLTSTCSCGRATSHGSGRRSQLSGLLVLPAVLDGLSEDAVFVAQPVAHGRELHRRHRIEEARRQAPEPAVAQARVGLLLEQLEPVEAAFARRPAAPERSSSRLVTLLASERPMRNSIER